MNDTPKKDPPQITFDPGALTMVSRMSGSVVDGLCRGLETNRTQFNITTDNEEEMLAHLGTQVLTVALCSFVHASFGSHPDNLAALVDRLNKTWDRMAAGAVRNEARLLTRDMAGKESN